MRLLTTVIIVFLLGMFGLAPSLLQAQMPAMERRAYWETKEGAFGYGQIVPPDQLWEAEDVVLIKQPRGYQRIQVADLEWLAIGTDTLFQRLSGAEGLSGSWQLLTGGTYDLYVQHKKRAGMHRGLGLGIVPLNWVLSLFAKRYDHQYALRSAGEWTRINFRDPTLQLGDVVEVSCRVPAQKVSLPTKRRLWRIGQAINACTPEGNTYVYPLQGPRWELGISTVLLTPTQRNAGERFQSYGGRVSIAKPLGFITKQLALQADLTWFNYRQHSQMRVSDISSIGEPAAYMFLAASDVADRDYAMQARMQHGILGLGLRWEVAPDANISMTLQWGMAWQFATTHQMKGQVLDTNDLEGLPSRVSVTEPVGGGWTAYGGLGLRSRLRHDWRLGLELRSYPVLDNHNWRFPPENFASWLQTHSLERMDADFAFSVELALTKVIF